MNDSTIIDTTRRDEVTAKPPSQLFTVRIWPELSDQGKVAWRGKVQHVPNGAWRYFQGGDGLIAFLQSQVEEFVRETQRLQSERSAESLGD